MTELMNNELIDIDGGQYPHDSSSQGYSMRSRSKRRRASDRRHYRRTIRAAVDGVEEVRSAVDPITNAGKIIKYLARD